METQDLILSRLLTRVPFEGWTSSAFEHAVEEAAIDKAEALYVFPNGLTDCIAWFETQADSAMLKAILSETLRTLRVPERIETLVMARLKHLAAYREAVRRLSAHYTLPLYAGDGLKALYRTVDAIWYAAGDASTDFSFYTRRATLAGVYSATLLFWLNDSSGDSAATKAFLERRLAGVMQFHRWKKRCAEALGPWKDFSFRRLFMGPKRKRF